MDYPAAANCGDICYIINYSFLKVENTIKLHQIKRFDGGPRGRIKKERF